MHVAKAISSIFYTTYIMVCCMIGCEVRGEGLIRTVRSVMFITSSLQSSELCVVLEERREVWAGSIPCW